MEVKKEYLDWLSSNDTGISSKTMLEAITEIPTGRCDIPYDMADVGRCVRMLRKFPDLRPQIGKVISKHIEWMPFIDCWKELERLYDECVEYESLSDDDKKRLKQKKYFYNPKDSARNLINELVTASRYLRGLRMQNNSCSWRNTPPESF